MNRMQRKQVFLTLLILAFALSVITGCGARIEPAPTAAASASPAETAGPTSTPTPTANPTPTVEPTAEPAPEPTTEPTTEPTAEPGQAGEMDEKPIPEPIINPDGSITVYTVEQFMNALDSYRVIELAEGVYNITDYYRASGSDDEPHQWFIEYGGLTLYGMQDLVIRAREGETVELVTEDAYADVLKLTLCENVRLEGITMGHAVEPGHCTGAVLELNYCKDIRLQDLDLYGCGTYGITAEHSIGVYTGNSVIRECSYGIMNLLTCSDFVFNGCAMRDCRGFEQLALYYSTVEFQGCEFSGNQSDYGYGLLSDNNTSDVFFSCCTFDAWELEQLEKQAPELSRVVFPWDEDHPCSYWVAWPTSIEELVEAIAPNTLIRLREMNSGTYDLSAYLEKVWAEEGKAWNARHRYVQIQECYDGLELLVRNCDGLSIVEYPGPRGAAEFEFTVDPRYATVLRFVNCDDLTLRGFTLGHTEPGECYGNVLAFENCHRVVLRDLDIYGCGFFGLELSDHCESFGIYDTVIRDCSAGPVTMEYCDGNIAFIGCTLTGSAGGGYYWGEDWELPYFLRCTFGDHESSTLLYREDILTELCEWSENITEYPDYPDDGFDEYDIDPANAAAVPMIPDILTSIYWVGWRYMEQDSDFTADLPVYDEDESYTQFFLTFEEDGHGLIQYYADGEIEELPFTWMIPGNYFASLFFDDSGESQASVALYREELDDENYCMWLLLSMEEIRIWFY